MPQPAFVMRALGRGGIRETRKWTQRPIPGKRTARPWAQTQSTFFTSPSHTDFLPEETGAGHQFLRFESSASSSAHLNYNIFTGKSFPIDFYKVRAVGFHYAIRPGTNFRVKRFGARLHSFSTKADEKVDYKESSDNPSSTKAFDNSSSSSPPPSLSSPSSSSSDESFSLKKTVVLLTGSQFINNLGFGCVIPVLPLFANDMGLGASGVGLILSTSAVARLCLNIPLGRLSDRIGRKPLMVGGQIGTALASLGTGMCSSLPQLLACRLLLGAGSSSALAGSGAYMADITTRAPNQRAKILGFQSTVINIAYAVGPAVGGYLCDLYGARLMFFIVGGAALLTSAGFSILPETYRGIQHANRVEDSDSDSVDAQKKSNAGAQQASAWQVYRPLLLDPDQQGLIAMNFAVFGSYSALMTVFPLFASSVLGEHGSVAEVGTLFAAGAVIGFVGAPLGGYLADKIGRKNTVVPAAFVISLGALLTAYAGSIDNPSFYTLLPAMLIWGFGNSVVNPGLSAFAADIAKDESTRSQALSLSRMAGDAAFLVCPFGLGLLAQYTDCETALYTSALITLLANATFAIRSTERFVPEAKTN